MLIPYPECRASLAIGATYLSDLATPETKTQILSLYEAANFGGMAIGPLIGEYRSSFPPTCMACSSLTRTRTQDPT